MHTRRTVFEPRGNQITAEPHPDSRETDQRAVIMAAAARRLTRITGQNTFAQSVALPIGIVSTLITVQYLTPAQFGQLGLLMILAAGLTQLYNTGLLHGTFLWVYGASGEGGDDVEIEGTERAGIGQQRTGMGSGLILTLIAVSAGTAVCLIFGQQLATLLLGSPRHSNLIALAAISGGSGSLYRLTVNVFRFERRFGTYALALVARPVGVGIASTLLVVLGYGVWGAVIGTVVPTLVCAVGCVLAAARSYRLRLTLNDAREIVVRGASVVIPVIALWIAHNGDLYLVAPFVSSKSLGVYRLASRLGSPPSYFASAVLTTWGPMERSALMSAAFAVGGGRNHFRSRLNTYYVLAGMTIVVLFVLFARVLVLLAPRSYANAAKVVPLIALAFVVYGGYIMLLRTARPQRMLLWYAISATASCLCFIGSAFLLIPAIGVYGAPAALTIGMGVGCAVIVWRNHRDEEPMPIEYRRIAATILVAGTVSAVALAGSHKGGAIAVIADAVALIAYVPGLIVARAIPLSTLVLIWHTIMRRGDKPRAVLSIDQLPAAERKALGQLRTGSLEGSADPRDYARLTRALRRLGGIGTPSSADVRIGRYLASRAPESVRDYELHEMINAGVDAFELDRLDVLAKAARRSRFGATARFRAQRRPPRHRIYALSDEE